MRPPGASGPGDSARAALRVVPPTNLSLMSVFFGCPKRRCCFAPRISLWWPTVFLWRRGTLRCSNRPCTDWFGLSPVEQAALPEAIARAKFWIEQHHQPDGYNIGMNCGEAAGQSVMHFHCHVIPRYSGDTPDPRGGVRGVIPEKQKY